MNWYTAHYHNHFDPRIVYHIPGTSDRKKIFSAAQDAANRTMQTVTVLHEFGGGSCGTSLKSYEVKPQPISNKLPAGIKFVRSYRTKHSPLCGPWEMFTVIYESGRHFTYGREELPATVKRFCEYARIVDHEEDAVLGHEVTWLP